MHRKRPSAAKSATTCPPDQRYLPGQPLRLDDFGPNESLPHTWANTAYKSVPAMSREELLAELERMDANVRQAAEWVETFSQFAPHATLTAVGNPLESIRDLVRLRALLPRIRFWLEFGAQGSSTLAVAVPADLRSYASRLAGLIMQIDGEAWRSAACFHYRTYWEPSSAAWRQAEADLRAELEGRLRDAFVHCLMRAPLVTGVSTVPLTQTDTQSTAVHPTDSETAGCTSGPEAPAED